MDTLNAVLIIEGGDASYEEVIEAYQFLIDTGLVWKLQGTYGRTAQHLIDTGQARPAEAREVV